MKIILSSKRHHYMARVSIFLVTVALIAGMVGCDGGDDFYTLTIASTSGGSVTIPGEGMFTCGPCSPEMVVGLVAEAEGGYLFVNWTGDVDIIGNVNYATTTITMHYSCSITANFCELITGGNGTEENPYQIANWHHLYSVRVYLDDYFILMNDLDSTTAGYGELASPTANWGKGWQPIGTEDSLFTGTFDGQGHEIRDLFINRPDERNNGLFGKTYEGGVIEDIGVVNVTVIGDEHVGGLVAWNQGTTVSNSYSTGSVSGRDDVGGLVGWNHDSTVINSYSTSNVTGDSDVGGLVGDNGGGTVINSFWDTETSGQATSPGGTGKTTAEMQDIATFSGAGWDIIAVAPGSTNTTYTWNIVDGQTYPFLSWQSVS